MLQLLKQLMMLNSPSRMKLFVSTPRRRGRGRGRGRVRPQPLAAPEVEQEPLVEPKASEFGPAVNAVGIPEINQGLAALNQTMSLVQQTL